MPDQRAEEIAKVGSSKLDNRVRLSPRRRLKSYLSHANLTSNRSTETISLPELVPSITSQATSFDPSLDGMCTRIRARLLNYPDIPLSRQYIPTVLRIIEYCSELARVNSELRETLDPKAIAAGERPNSAPQHDDHRHCQTCSCSEADFGTSPSTDHYDYHSGQDFEGYGNTLNEIAQSMQARKQQSRNEVRSPIVEIFSGAPRSSFYQSSREAISSQGSDISSGRDNLPPNEEYNLNRCVELATKLTKVFVKETGGPEEPFHSSLSKILLSSLPNAIPHGHSVTQQQAQKLSPCITPWATPHNEIFESHIQPEDLHKVHHRNFSFIPGDDALGGKSLQPQDTYSSAQRRLGPPSEDSSSECFQTTITKQISSRRESPSIPTRESSNTSEITVIGPAQTDPGRPALASNSSTPSNFIRTTRISDKVLTGPVAAAVTAAARFAAKSSGSVDKT